LPPMAEVVRKSAAATEEQRARHVHGELDDTAARWQHYRTPASPTHSKIARAGRPWARLTERGPPGGVPEATRPRCWHLICQPECQFDQSYNEDSAEDNELSENKLWSVGRANFDYCAPRTYGHLEKFLSPSGHESDSVTARGYRRMERAGHGAEGLFRC
jgi:hypothetical protein